MLMAHIYGTRNATKFKGNVNEISCLTLEVQVYVCERLCANVCRNVSIYVCINVFRNVSINVNL